VRSPAELLQDMLDAIERVERYAARGRNAFNTDELIQTWIVHHIEIIGEAATRLDRVFPAEPARSQKQDAIAAAETGKVLRLDSG